MRESQVLPGCGTRVLAGIGIFLAGVGVKTLAGGGDAVGAAIGIVLGLSALGAAAWLYFGPRD
ncbi:MAG TPA: hypothetical protein VG387_09840 [Rhizomicrobium sp.]|nr:hypothetical protein [Rhizomicrobium sp.]